MERAARFTRYIEKVANAKGLAKEFSRNVENGLTSFGPAAHEAEKSAEFWLEAIDREVFALAEVAVNHALMVAQHHIESGHQFDTLNAYTLSKQSLELWKEKNHE